MLKRLLIVESNPVVARVVREQVQSLGAAEVATATSWQAALTAACVGVEYDFIFLEARLDGCRWPADLARLRQLQPQARLLVLDYNGEPSREVLDAGADDITDKRQLLDDLDGYLQRWLGDGNGRPG